MAHSESLRSALARIADIHADLHQPGTVTVAGWVRTRRASKKFSFLEIHDGSHANSIQVIADQNLSNYSSEIDRITTGCSVRITGQLVVSPGKGQKYEIQAQQVEVVGWADPESYPLQKKEMTLEYLREVAHLRPRTNTFGSIFRLRHIVSHAIHEFFDKEGFFYAHTPLLTTADGEGAGECFKVTNFDLAKVPKKTSGEINYEEDFFGEKTMLCVTGQLEGELMTMGLGRVYTFGPTFRAENSNTSRHLAEFWMVEPEAAFFNLHDNMELGEKLIRFVVRRVLDRGRADLEQVWQKFENNTLQTLEQCLEKDFVRVSYTEAVKILETCGQSFENPVFWGCDLKSEHERYLCEKHFNAPTFVFDYPAELKAFYMYLNDDGKTVRAMDLLMPGIGEVIGGSQREDREDVLLRRMKDLGIDAEHMDWYVTVRRWGGVPHSGFGLGLERLLSWVSGVGNVRDLIPFPRTPGHCKY